MAYSPSPRPTYPGPTHIPYTGVTRHLWGDPEAGQVSDWIYASTDKIHQIVFGLAPGAKFGHSDSFRTIFAADELMYVLSGVMLLCNPQTGEVHRVRPGEAAFFRRDTWHHAFNHSREPLRVLEYFAPPPSQGTSGAYARTKPNLTESRYIQNDLLGRWPMERTSIEQEFTIQVLREEDLLWRLEGQENRVLTGLFAATEHLTAGKIDLEPGHYCDPQTHDGDECLYVLEGTVQVYVPEAEGQSWFELRPQDGFYVPAGVSIIPVYQISHPLVAHHSM